jgi:hypothetical protein
VAVEEDELARGMTFATMFKLNNHMTNGIPDWQVHNDNLTDSTSANLDQGPMDRRHVNVIVRDFLSVHSVEGPFAMEVLLYHTYSGKTGFLV